MLHFWALTTASAELRSNNNSLQWWSSPKCRSLASGWKSCVFWKLLFSTACQCSSEANLFGKKLAHCLNTLLCMCTEFLYRLNSGTAGWIISYSTGRACTVHFPHSQPQPLWELEHNSSKLEDVAAKPDPDWKCRVLWTCSNVGGRDTERKTTWVMPKCNDYAPFLHFYSFWSPGLNIQVHS